MVARGLRRSLKCPQGRSNVNHPTRLGEDDRLRFSDAVEASLDVMSRQQFFVWTQSSVQSLIPHEIMICGVEDGTCPGMAVHRFSASRYFRQEHFDVVIDPINGLMPRLLAASEASRCSVVFCPQDASREVDEVLLELITDNEMKNLAAQLVLGARGQDRHAPAAGNPQPHQDRQDQPGNCRTAELQPLDHQEPHPGHLAQARLQHPHARHCACDESGDPLPRLMRVTRGRPATRTHHPLPKT